MTSTITTDALLDVAERRTGLARRQLLTMVAKSAAVRHVATRATGGGNFVLKGGTLLTHVYRSPRQSIADADYLHLDREGATTDGIERALRFSERGFNLDTALRFDGGNDSFTGKGVFTFDDIKINRVRDRELKITVSIRPGERMDPPTAPLFYTDSALAENQTFPIEGLTINELCAEKMLAWCSKDLAKHLVDLAYVAREQAQAVDHDRVAGLVRDKFAIERHAGRYVMLGIRDAGQLAQRFRAQDRLRRVLHRDWTRLSTDEIFFLPAEREQPAERQLLEPDNVQRIALEFWEETLAQL